MSLHASVNPRHTRLLTGNKAAAWGARLADVDYIPAFPITPQTEIIETLSAWTDAGEMPARLTMLESEHSMITAAGTAAAAGARTFTATSSQGLLYGLEMLYALAGWRVPLVLVNVSRGLSAPVTLEPDHNDVLAARDSGFLQIHCSTCQEVLDSVLIAYRLSEDRRVRLPVIVNLDGFYLSFTREPVTVPEPEMVRRFLPTFDLEAAHLRASDPQSLAVSVLGGSSYSYFRYEVQLAANRALDVFEEAASDFAVETGRFHEPVHAYRMEDAEYAFFMMGSFATKAMHAVNRLREDGLKVGLIRPRLIRPLPKAHLRRLAARVKGIAVVDQNLSPGLGGVLYSELAGALYDLPTRPMLVSYVGGLGGRDIKEGELARMIDEVKLAVDDGHPPPPRLLYSEEELRGIRKLQTIANRPRPPEVKA